MTFEELRRDLLITLDYAYIEEDWITPLEEALNGLSAGEALQKADPDSTSIWEIVLHLAIWNENIVERIRTGTDVHPEAAWPPVPTQPGDEDWEAAKNELRDSLQSLRTLFETMTEEELANSPYGLPDLLLRFVHMGYHLGQITKMRSLGLRFPD